MQIFNFGAQITCAQNRQNDVQTALEQCLTTFLVSLRLTLIITLCI